MKWGEKMRFLHTADWHIGKNLNGFDLISDQQQTFNELEQIAKDEQVDAVVIAGDLYDRSIPSEQAVRALNRMLTQLNLGDHFPVLAISGNHDSAARLGVGSDWFAYQQMYLNTSFAAAFKSVVITDTQFFLLPFFGIQTARNYFKDNSIKNINQAMKRVVATMEEQFLPDKHHVLVAHFFAAGSHHTADSETLVEVGGLSAVETTTLAPFDYVALGHLHNHQALEEERVRYSGSPQKFSVSEANQEKGVWIVDTNPFKIKWIPLSPVHDIHQLTGSFEKLCQDYHDYPQDDFYDIALTDHKRIPDVLNRLRNYYPKIVSLHRVHQAQTININNGQKQAHRDPMELLSDFYQQTMGISMTVSQKQLAAKALSEITDQEE